MLKNIPTEKELQVLLGDSLFPVWNRLCAVIEENYDMERLWNSGGKAWVYEYKYRRGGKTLCALYARENCIGFLVIFGKAEREKFEASRPEYPESIQRAYDEAATYHDGKWVMFQPEDSSLFSDFIKLLSLKRRPNKKKTDIP